MKNVSIARMTAFAATTVASMVALALPASALGISVSASAVAVKDCRTVMFSRAANYDLSFSSKPPVRCPSRPAAFWTARSPCVGTCGRTS